MAVDRLDRTVEFFLCSSGNSDRRSGRLGGQLADLACRKTLAARSFLEWPDHDRLSRLGVSFHRAGVSRAGVRKRPLVLAPRGAHNRNDHALLGYRRPSLVRFQSGFWLEQIFIGVHPVAQTLVEWPAGGLLDLDDNRNRSARLVVSRKVGPIGSSVMYGAPRNALFVEI